ncbi:MAG: response regulator, partial [Actinomycetes bacterium]
MSHEIRTPMNGVLGMLEMLTVGGLNEKQQEYVSVAQSSADTMLVVINDILDFSKLEAGKLTLEHIPFDVRESVEDVTALCGAQAAAKGLDVSCYFPTDVRADVLGDPNRLRQILVNLVGNAVKFTHVGEVAVSVSQVGFTGAMVRLRFEVRDTGIGINPATRARLFESFSQGDTSTTREFGGTGLGLTISHQLVTLMGGTLDVVSSEGRGTTFAVELEFDLQEGPGDGLAPFDAESRIRALVVDDHMTSRSVLIRYLRDWGLRAEGATDSTQALAMLIQAADSEHRDSFTMVFIDAQLPVVAGVTLADSIKGDSRIRDVRLVLIVSATRQESAPVDNQFEVSISKPVRQSVVRAVVAGVVDTSTPLVAIPLPELAQAPPAPRQFRGEVLLVEDNSVNQRVAKGMLARLGLATAIAGDGAEALRMLEQKQFDLVLMDCQMPVMDGFAATREFRRTEPSGNRLPIIALTAGVMTGTEAACHLAGMDGYLSKPYRLAELQAAIEPWLSPLPD